MNIENCIEQIEKKIAIINGELKEVCERLATLEADVRWIRWGIITIASGILAMLFKLFVQ